MKIRLSTLTILCCILSCTNSTKPKDSKSIRNDSEGIKSDVRNITWGDSPKEVKVKETWEFNSEAKGTLLYNGSVFNLPCQLIYEFNDSEKLSNCAYIFSHDHTIAGDYLTDFQEIKKLLIEKYGKPTNDTIIRKDHTPLIYIDMDLRSGRLTYITTWLNERTIISLLLNGGESKVTLSISYHSKEYYESPQKKALKDL